MKKILRFLFFLLCSSSALASIYINLGQDCQAAVRLREFNLRKSAFPFDWLRSYNFKGICKCINEKFAFFLDPHHLQYKNEMIGTWNNSRIINIRYNVEFVHDFPTIINSNHVAQENENEGIIVTNYLDYLPQVQDKYSKRIARFLSVLNGTASVIFFRTHITPEEAFHFTEIMKKLYPQLNYTLVIVHNNKKLFYEWKIPHVKNFYASEKDISNNNNWFHRKEWAKIFRSLGIEIFKLFELQI